MKIDGRIKRLEQALVPPLKIRVEIVDDDFIPDEEDLKSGRVIFIRLEEERED